MQTIHKKLGGVLAVIFLAASLTALFHETAVYAAPFLTGVGGTGSTSPSGILYGDNGSTNHLNTVTIGSNLTFSGGVLSASGGGSSSGLATTSPWTIGNLAYVTDNGHVSSVATTSATCSSGISCGAHTVIGAAPVSFTNTGVLSIQQLGGGSAQTGAITISTSTTAINNDIGITNSSGAFTFNFPTATASIRGFLSAADWVTFNAKQAAGNYITALTGDGTASGPGSVAFTLATVNANLGSFGGSTAIPNFTVNGKGLITAAGTSVVIAPAGTLTGTTLNSTVVTSSLTSVGTLGSLNVSGLASFGLASTSQLSVFQKAYFGGTATSTFDSAGNLVIPSGSNLTVTGKSDGCATWATGVLNSTGTACGSGGGGSPGGASSTIQYNANGAFGGIVNVFTDGTSLGVGTTTPNKPFMVEGTTAGGVARIQRDITSPLINAVYGTYDVILNQASTTLANLTGPAQTFGVSLNGAAENIYGDISVFRDSADTSGGMRFRTYNSGTPGVGITIDHLQNVGIGTTTPGTIFSIGTAPSQIANFTSATSSIYQNIIVAGGQSNPYLQVGGSMSGPSYGYLVNDRANFIDGTAGRNDYDAVNVINPNAGTCATADITTTNDLASNAAYFNDLGHTSSGFTGVGCTNNPFTGFGANSSYQFDPSGDINYAATAGNFKWFTGGYATSNMKMTLTNAGLVGIGTTSPVSLLTVSGSDTQTNLTLSNVPTENIINTNTTVNNHEDLAFSTADSSGFTILGAKIAAVNLNHTASNVITDLAFLTRNGSATLENMRLTGTGNLGIGTTTPTNKLEVLGTTYLGGATNVVSTAAQAFLVSRAGTTTPAFQVDDSAANAGNGVDIITNAAGTAPMITAVSANVNENLELRSKGAGSLVFRHGATAMFTVAQSAITFAATAILSTASTVRFSVTSGADTAMTASTEATHTYFNLNSSRQHATGALTLQRDFRITGSDHSFVGASTLTDDAAFAVDLATGGSGNATITNIHDIYVPSIALTGTKINSYGITINANTGATNNYAAEFLGGNVGIGTSSPTAAVSSVAASTTSGTVQTAYAGAVSIVAGLENTVTMLFQTIGQWGDVYTGGDAPTLSSCGTSPSFIGAANMNDQTIQVGSVAATGCTTTFAHPWKAAPTCTVTERTGSVVNALSYTVSTTAVVVTQTGLTGDVLDIRCEGTQ